MYKPDDSTAVFIEFDDCLNLLDEAKDDIYPINNVYDSLIHGVSVLRGGQFIIVSGNSEYSIGSRLENTQSW